MWKSCFRELCKAFQAFLFQMEQTASGKYLHDASCSHETGWKHPNMRAHLSTAKEVWLESMLPCQEKELPRVTNCFATHSLKALHQNIYIYIHIIVNCTIFLYISFHQGTVCDSEWGQYSKIASPLWSASSLINDHKTSNLKVFVFTASEGSCILENIL